MKKSSNKPTLIPKMYCNLFGHDFEVTKRVTYHVKEYTCRHCRKELTTNSNGTLTELTPKFKEINAILERIHTSRTERLKNKSLASSIY
ncbi:MAG: hypothetical protein P8K68_14200 [Algibacter sp.]|uniref:hypothetical protein n=1 Tax=Algibacter sp. TaxID=1872428 RepID=UPI002609A5AD|nr:hypothetical protein [Algibacter sp.]MDG1731011.1 hypothetical protein [Algibacter sp.]MDG2179918.1 hypothetical protein [Algibacter sp.]